MTKQATDPAAELRLETGFPANAGIWMRGLLIIALAAMLLGRRKHGVRTVGLFRLIVLAVLTTFWNLIASLVVASGDKQAFLMSFSGGAGFTIALLMIGLAKRFTRWFQRQRGEQLNANSLGLSVCFRGLPNAIAERYLDALLCIGAGLAMCLPAVPIRLPRLRLMARG